jgi:NAD(P)-dependent dehydrogenase (short-subunit alcohol dehydrogenase family)
MDKLANKTAVVTGGTSGIGYSTVEELKIQGAKVMFTGRKKDRIAEAANKLGATGVVADQADLAQIDNLVKKAAEELGKVDILVINAGSLAILPFESVTEEFYETFLTSNLKGAFFTIQKFLPILNDNASIVLISAAGTVSTAARGASVYYIAKAGYNSLVRSLSVELAPRGIRVNAVLPAAISTPIFKDFNLPDEVLAGLMEKLKQAIPLKRVGQPKDVANLVAFLSSDDSSFISGTEYIIDGGLARNPPI